MNLNLLGMATWQIVMLVVLGVLVLAFAIIPQPPAMSRKNHCLLK